MKKNYHTFNCKFCGQAVDPGQWQGGECAGCGSVLCTCLPTERELGEYYQNFNETYDGGHRGGANLVRYANRYLQIVRRYVQKGHIVDIGSSKSPFPNTVASAGFSVAVIDYVEPKGLASNIRFEHGNLNDASILQKHGCRYDVVTAWAVMEHVPNPQLACQILVGMCKPGGFIFLSTPEIGTALTNNSIGRSSWFCPPMHLHLISAAAIRMMFSRNGCDLIRCGRLELNWRRWLVRYGIGIVEMVIGFPLKKLNVVGWRRLRDARIQKFMGIAYFVIQKHKSETEPTES